MDWKWSKADKHQLASFVNPEVICLFDKLTINTFDANRNSEGRKAIVEAIYQGLLDRHIKYAQQPYQAEEETQLIRPPQSILGSPGEANCLDLSLLFCGLCLGYGLSPLLILLTSENGSRHACVAVSLAHKCDEWDAHTRDLAFRSYTQEVFRGDDNLSKLKSWIEEKSYLAIECTGVAHTQSFVSSSMPEAEGRVDDILSFEQARIAGEKQLEARSFDYAIDIAQAHNFWKIPVRPIPGVVSRVSQAAVEEFLEAIADDAAKVELFHNNRQQIVLPKLYIPVQVTQESGKRSPTTGLGRYAETSEDFKRVYAYNRYDDEEQSKLNQEWLDVRQKHTRLVILADPGMGKSTLLRQEAGMTARDELDKLKAGATTDEIVFPLRLRLSDLAKKNTGGLLDIIPGLVKEAYPKVGKEVLPLLQRKLEQGQCLLLLDAWDEVPTGERSDLRRKLDGFVDNNACRVFCTSRIVGYEGNFLRDAQEVELVPFAETQIEQYVTTWFKYVPTEKADTPTTKNLLQELRQKPQIQGLAQNPLMLSLICSLYQQKKFVLPTRRVKIYEEAVDCMLERWNYDRGSEFQRATIAKKDLLTALAFHFSDLHQEVFHHKELFCWIDKYLKQEAAPRDFQSAKTQTLIDELSEQDGILQKLTPTGKQYLFLHRTFQEYLTAVCLCEADELDLVKKYIWDFDWHETLILMAGLHKKPLSLLKMLTQGKDDIFKSQLLLAGRCLAECGELTDPLAIDIIDRIFKFWQDYPEIPFLRSVVVELGRTQPAMLKHLKAALHSPKPDPLLELTVFHEPDSPDSLRHTLLVLGQIGNDSVVPDIIAACIEPRRGNWRAVGDTLLSIGGETGLHPLLSMYNGDNKVGNRRRRAWREINIEHLKRVILDRSITRNPETGHSPRIEGTRYLGYRADPEAFETLSQILQDPTDDAEVRSSAALALGSLGDPRGWEVLVTALEYTAVSENAAEVVDEITQLLSNALNPSVAENAARAIEEMGHPSTDLNVLRVTLQDQRISIVKATIKTLATLGDLDSVAVLLALAVDTKRPVELREQAVNAIATILQRQDFSGLATLEELAERSITMMFDQCNPLQIRQEAFLILQMLPGQLSFDLAYNFLESPQIKQNSNEFKNRVLSALINININRAVELMTEMLKQENPYLGHRTIIYHLSRIPTPLAFEILSEILDGNDQALRSHCSSLSNSDNPSLVKKLATFYVDRNSDLQRAAIDVLLKLEPSQACDPLAEILQDSQQDRHTRERVAEALGKIDSPKAIQAKAVQALLATLSDPQPELVRKVAAALAEQGRPEAIDILAQDFLKMRSFGFEVNSLKKLKPTDVLPTLFEMARCIHHLSHSSVLEALEALGQPQVVLEFLIEDPAIDLFKPEIFAVARRLAIRCAKENLSFIPLHPEFVVQQR
jgi:HEAT repeat protein